MIDYNYIVRVSAEGYEDTKFESFLAANCWLNKLKAMGLNAELEEIDQ